MLGQHRISHDRRGERTRDQCTGVVDEEDTIGIAVEGQTHIGAGLDHAGLEVTEILGLDRIGRMVRERPVEFPVEDLEVEREAVEDGGGGEPTHAVRGIGDDPERTQDRWIDERLDVCHEGRERIIA